MVRCLDCGHYALRDLDTREICEADEKFRELGVQPKHYGAKRRFAMPAICAKAVLQFPPPEADAHRCAQQERDCDHYCKYHPGRLPKEHDEMRLLDAVEAKHEKWRREDLDRQDKFEHSVERRYRANLLLTLVGVIVSLLLGLGAIGISLWAALLKG